MERRSLFFTSCVALITTAIAFSVRGDVLDALGVDFHLNHEQLGVILSPAFWGFTVSILIGGSLVDYTGARPSPRGGGTSNGSKPTRSG